MAPPPKELDASQPASTTTSWREAIDNPRLMIAVLFLVTAATGLPFLWMSRGFSLTAKIVLTILVLLWTALVLWAFYLVMAWCIPRILEPFQ
jgi:hypothetical protein